MDVPGIFFYLGREGALSSDDLAPLLAALPPERVVCTAARGGEAFDSTRWPLVHDATLARLAARRIGDPLLMPTLRAIEAAAAGGLYAYHVHRRIPGPSAELALPIVRHALQTNALSIDELVQAAITVTRYVAPRRSVALDELALRMAKACVDVGEAAAIACGIFGESFGVGPLPTSGGLVMSAHRALVMMSIAAPPTWWGRVRVLVPASLDLLDGEWTLVLPSREPLDPDRAPAAVAALVGYVRTSLDAHVDMHPGDADLFPVIDDEAIRRLFR